MCFSFSCRNFSQGRRHRDRWSSAGQLVNPGPQSIPKTVHQSQGSGWSCTPKELGRCGTPMPSAQQAAQSLSLDPTDKRRQSRTPWLLQLIACGTNTTSCMECQRCICCALLDFVAHSSVSFEHTQWVFVGVRWGLSNS